MGEHDSFAEDPSTLAKLVSKSLGKSSKVLDLGCGNGRDSRFFAHAGCYVVAVDISGVIIEKNKNQRQIESVKYKQMDISRGLGFKSWSFDLVFANLSLHYYSDDLTKYVFQEATRVLKVGGLMAFSCKSVNDFHFGNGQEIEKNLFVSDTGHVRHLFTLDYTKLLLKTNLELELLEEIDEEYNNEKSNIIICIARKK